MCKKMPVIPVNRLVETNRKIKKWRSRRRRVTRGR
jgi:hypothetical protein